MAFKAKDKGRPTEENVDMVDEAKDESKHAAEPGEAADDAEERHEMKSGEELKRGGRHKRARGGHLDAADEHRTHRIGDPKPHHPHHHPKRRGGGHVPGHHPKGRPDRRARGGDTSGETPFEGAEKAQMRARGGATADLNPTTAAGNVSIPDYERQPKIPNGGNSRGADNKGKNG